MRLHDKNRRVPVYSKQLLATKQQVKISRINKRRAAASRLTGTGVAVGPEARRGQTRR